MVWIQLGLFVLTVAFYQRALSSLSKNLNKTIEHKDRLIENYKRMIESDDGLIAAYRVYLDNLHGLTKAILHGYRNGTLTQQQAELLLDELLIMEAREAFLREKHKENCEN